MVVLGYDGCCSIFAGSACDRQKLAKGGEQAERIHVGHTASSLIPLRQECLRVINWHQGRSQLGKGIVIETEVCSHELFFQNSLVRKQSHGSALVAVGRRKQDFVIPFKEGSRHAASDVFGKCNRAVIESNLNGCPIDG